MNWSVKMNNQPDLREIHCTRCGKFLGFEFVMLGIVEIKCKGCKEWTTISNFPEELDKKEPKGYSSKRKVGKVP